MPFTFKSLVHTELGFVWYKMGIRFFVFQMASQCFQYRLLTRISPVIYNDISGHITRFHNVQVCFQTYIFSSKFSIPVLIPFCLNYFTFVSFAIQLSKFFSGACWPFVITILGPLLLHTHFRTNISVSTKSWCDYDWKYIFCTSTHEENWHFYNITFLYISSFLGFS